jgi:hypothetical protein
MGLPPLDGAVHERVAVPVPPVISRDVGAPGTLADTKEMPLGGLAAVPSLLVDMENALDG